MSRVMMLLVLAALFVAPTGCASLQAQQQSPFAGLPFRHDGFDFKKAWKAAPSPKGLTVELALKNVRNSPVEDVEVKVALLRKGYNAVVAEDAAFIIGTVGENQYCSLGLILKNASASPGDLLRFIIQYRTVDSTNSSRWTSDFTADAISGVAIHKREEMPSEE